MQSNQVAITWGEGVAALLTLGVITFLLLVYPVGELWAGERISGSSTSRVTSSHEVGQTLYMRRAQDQSPELFLAHARLFLDS